MSVLIYVPHLYLPHPRDRRAVFYPPPSLCTGRRESRPGIHLDLGSGDRFLATGFGVALYSRCCARTLHLDHTEAKRLQHLDGRGQVLLPLGNDKSIRRSSAIHCPQPNVVKVAQKHRPVLGHVVQTRFESYELVVNDVAQRPLPAQPRARILSTRRKPSRSRARPSPETQASIAASAASGLGRRARRSKPGWLTSGTGAARSWSAWAMTLPSTRAPSSGGPSQASSSRR